MRYKKILSRKGMLSQYPERTYMESDRGKGNGNGSAPPPPPPTPPDHLGIEAKICDPKPTASVVDFNDPETWGEYTGIHPHPAP